MKFCITDYWVWFSDMDVMTNDDDGESFRKCQLFLPSISYLIIVFFFTDEYMFYFLSCNLVFHVT
jgi:hypothetical protein